MNLNMNDEYKKVVYVPLTDKDGQAVMYGDLNIATVSKGIAYKGKPQFHLFPTMEINLATNLASTTRKQGVERLLEYLLREELIQVQEKKSLTALRRDAVFNHLRYMENRCSLPLMLAYCKRSQLIVIADIHGLQTTPQNREEEVRNLLSSFGSETIAGLFNCITSNSEIKEFFELEELTFKK